MVSTPAYSEEELREFEQNSNEKITIDGKDYTRYECSQIQRKLETKLRYARDEKALYKAMGDEDLTNSATEKIRILSNKYAEVSNKASLPMRAERTRNVKAGLKDKKLFKNVKLPDDFIRSKGLIDDSIKKNIAESLSKLEKEYNIKIDEISFEDISEQGKIPFQFCPINDNGKFKSKLIINSGYNWNPTLEEFNERIYKNNYLKGILASQNTEDLIRHECAHFMTFQDCMTWEDFLIKEREVRRRFVRGISDYNNCLEDGAESIAEAFVKIGHGQTVPDDALKLLDKYIMGWKK